MASFEKDGFTFFDGFFNEPVFNLDISNFEEKLSYLKENKIKNVSLDKSLIDFSFLRDVDFLEEVYISNNVIIKDFHALKNLKRIVVNIERGKPNLDYSNFIKLEYLSIDWYNNFPDLSSNINLKELIIWKFKPKSKSFVDLKIPQSLENFEITESNVANLQGLSLPNLRKFEAHYCSALESIEGIENSAKHLEILTVDFCKKLIDYNKLKECSKLEKIILGNCGEIKTLKWLNNLKNVKHFSFWNTKLLDGDTSPCFGIDYVNFKNEKHYSYKVEEFGSVQS
jgi:hypothetical protein